MTAGHSRQAKHRKNRRSLGLCGHEGCKEKSGHKYHCPQHAAAAAKRAREYRAARNKALAA